MGYNCNSKIFIYWYSHNYQVYFDIPNHLQHYNYNELVKDIKEVFYCHKIHNSSINKVVLYNM